MTSTDTQTLTNSPGSHNVAQTGQLVLRLRGTSRDGEIVRLQAPKCTIGSDRRCTLRLDLPGIHPVHCLIVRGHRTTVVRRWSPDTQLNGSAFSDAELTPGDRLEIGPVEMEILESNPSAPPSQSPKSEKSSESLEIANVTKRLNLSNRQGRRRARLLAAQLRDARAEIERLNNQIQQAPQIEVQQATELDSQREQLLHEADQIEAQKAALEQQRVQWEQQRSEQEKDVAERQARLDTCEAEAVSREHQLDEHQRQVETQRTLVEESQRHVDECENSLEEDRHRLEAEKAELEVQKTQFEQNQQAWEKKCRTQEEAWQAQQEKISSESSITDKDEQARREELAHDWEDLEAQKNDLSTQQTAFEEEKKRWEAEVDEQRLQWQQQQDQLEEHHKQSKKKHDEVEMRLSDWEHELDLREAKLEEQRKLLDESLSSRHAQPSSQSVPSPVQAPEGDSALSPKLVAPLPKSEGDEAPPEETSLSTPTEVPEKLSTDSTSTRETHAEEEPQAPEPQEAASEDDDSIDEYMAQLMRRLNVMTDSEATDDSAPDELKKPATQSRQAYLSASHPYRQKKEEKSQEEDEKAKKAAAKRAAANRQRSAFENLTSLAAMRELATATASSAISTHTRRQLKKTSLSKLSVSLVSLTLGISLILGKLFWGFQDWQLYIGVVGIFLALLWILQYAIIAGRLTFGGPVGLQWNKAEAKTDDTEDEEASSQDATSDKDE